MDCDINLLPYRYDAPEASAAISTRKAQRLANKRRKENAAANQAKTTTPSTETAITAEPVIETKVENSAEEFVLPVVPTDAMVEN